MPGSSPLTRGKPICGAYRDGDDRLIPAHAGKTAEIDSLHLSAPAHPRSRGENARRVNRVRRRGGLIPAHAGKTTSSFASPTTPRAHPRSRGENAKGAGNALLGAGSSPLTRGKLHVRVVPVNGCRLIPAHAGKTRSVQCLCRSVRAHPRSRGENLIVDRPANPQAGSSPLTRGKRVSNSRECREIRLIPAHAGKTRCSGRRQPGRGAHPRSRGENSPGASTATSYAWLIPAHAGKTCTSHAGIMTDEAHPRSRGENLRGGVVSRLYTGSSPLTRGKRFSLGAVSNPMRLIPAHAGKTCLSRAVAARTAAHPRSRGENLRSSPNARSLSGSSPLTRGKRPARGSPSRTRGLIPAHAGKTGRSPSERPGWTAHPRSRGENARILQDHAVQVGSSPLTRGKPHPMARQPSRCRLIPAHAGKTEACQPLHLLDGAHPRSRGENRIAWRSPAPCSGSSPLTRGKQPVAVSLNATPGLIPAHAGKTRNTPGT